MVIPVLAGILSALRRVIARRVSLKVFISISVKLHLAFFFFGGEKGTAFFASHYSDSPITMVLSLLTYYPVQYLVYACFYLRINLRGDFMP